MSVWLRLRVARFCLLFVLGIDKLKQLKILQENVGEAEVCNFETVGSDFAIP